MQMDVCDAGTFRGGLERPSDIDERQDTIIIRAFVPAPQQQLNHSLRHRNDSEFPVLGLLDSVGAWLRSA